MEFDFAKFVIILAIIFFSVSFHELAHGLVAYWLGDNTAKDAGRLTLNPIKSIDPYMSIIVPAVLYLIGAPVFGGAKPVPVDFSKLKWREWGMALVAVVGPLTNFLLAFVFFVIGHFTGLIYGDDLPAFIFLELVLVNIGFTLFNILPFPPLDGSRVLFAIAPDGVRKVMASLEVYGIYIVLLLVLVFGNLLSSYTTGGMNAILDFFYMLVGVK